MLEHTATAPNLNCFALSALRGAARRTSNGAWMESSSGYKAFEARESTQSLWSTNTNQWVGRSTKFAHITKEVSGIGIGIGIGVQYYLENIEILNIEMRWKWRWVIIILNIILMLEWKVEEEGVASVGLYEDCGAQTHTCAICSTSTFTTAILVLFTVLHSYCAIYCTSTCTHLYLYHNIHVPFTVPHICLYF